jgi:pyruvate,water dikinase
MFEGSRYVVWFENLGSVDVSRVGGKNASLGEMIGTLKGAGIQVPGGFATTSRAYREFLDANGFGEELASLLEDLRKDKKPLQKVGSAARRLFLKGTFPEEIASDILQAYEELGRRYADDEPGVAVRSSATAEDLPDASFAGQQETFLNISGGEELLEACRRCYASLFTDRAISYREEKGFDHMKVALSVGVQKMVRADRSGSGVMFSIDTETGFTGVVVINAAWGLGENVVQGAVTPDEYLVFKGLLDDTDFKPVIGRTLGTKERKMVYAKGGSRTTRNVQTTKKERRAFVLEEEEILKLARWACRIEEHYGKAMDMEWAKDADSQDLFIVQARPETVQSRKEADTLKTYTLKEKGEPLLTGLSIGQAVTSGEACLIENADAIEDFRENAVLVTEMTDPDWVPIMKRSAGIVTDQGGRTCHAAIVSRELGIPAVVGCGDATEVISDGQEITLSCAEGDRGYIYEGALDYEMEDVSLEGIPETRTRIMMNIASPAAAFRWWRLPCEGIGLARMEFIINNIIKIHPMALVHFDDLEDKEAKRQIRDLTHGYEDPAEYFVDHLALGIARIAASRYPNPVIVRMSDFKTNEYSDLIGGEAFEPRESNPMLGFRGACRYYSDRYREGFALECRAVKRVREEIGLDNVRIMIPFCRTPVEADRVLKELAYNGLIRGKRGLEVYVMCEIPANVVLAERFAERFDGFSIGSNDLTQLILGVDRDSSDLSDLFDEQDEAVKREIARIIKTAHAGGCKVGICGQAPSDFPDFAAFLVKEGIDSISLNPDSVIPVKRHIAGVEAEAEIHD